MSTHCNRIDTVNICPHTVIDAVNICPHTVIDTVNICPHTVIDALKYAKLKISSTNIYLVGQNNKLTNRRGAAQWDNIYILYILHGNIPDQRSHPQTVVYTVYTSGLVKT